MQPTIFFAIPCGWFYEEQRKIIEKVCDRAGIDKAHRIIVEDDTTPAGLWEKICDSIARADFFMADVSSKRPNILLELGCALRAKELERVAYFISNNATVLEVLSDLSGIIRNQYSSMSDFTAKLIQWLEQSVKVEPGQFRGLQEDSIEIREDFKDLQGFLNRWTTPSGCQFNLTHEGLRFTNAYYPILSANLELLQDYEFAFHAKIEREAIGWVVKGTLNYPNPLPNFCVMFSITDKGMLRPHILSPGAKLDYLPFLQPTTSRPV